MPSPSDTFESDPHLHPLWEDHGPVTIEPADDLFERTIVSIVRQQLSMDSAAAIRERLFEAVEITPAGVLAAEEETLRETGLSGSKAEYVQNVARAFDANGYDHEYFAGMSDEAVVDELTEIAGVGPWSADMVLMFGLGREDVFPVGDLGIRQGMHELVDPELTRAEMVEHAETWAPHRSYASLLLWRAVD
ncbi:DNA-3-methyladenine glycosylase [Salinarchaeum chitinilyticum]